MDLGSAWQGLPTLVQGALIVYGVVSYLVMLIVGTFILLIAVFPVDENLQEQPANWREMVVTAVVILVLWAILSTILFLLLLLVIGGITIRDRMMTQALPRTRSSAT